MAARIGGVVAPQIVFLVSMRQVSLFINVENYISGIAKF